MVDLAILLAFLGASAWVAARAFNHPNGIYLRSLIRFAMATVAALAMWWLASPLISNEAGLGAFFLFSGIVGLAALLAIVACVAASARRIWDALPSRK
jgi:hypothetical protein